MSDLHPDAFGGTDEESHLMAQTAAKDLFLKEPHELDDPFAVHPTASGTPMPAEEHVTLIDNLAPKSLDFEHLRQKNQERMQAGVFAESLKWGPPEIALCAAGEMGETLNAIKKHFLRAESNPTVLEIGYEIADVVIYLDLLASSIGFHLEDLVAEKFNIVSERKKCEVML